ncbi:hypothetical protein P170DRAFT_432471 [Aspergillus steynii IBT 23096]|uniref:Uncharacterized protein n=1 Tax=Aspergillus steynii IBT 23096 TaxID=1392250 RepID=A0A2I2GPZ5_9EURO|nr:uncharacterized protein P170DRAFT_432471 [Aspergillus steynii IBT 23096]PLB54947.1 hypothetical protein P170DRAFT_432471 [Aspergillus steynii IBT 23096]
MADITPAVWIPSLTLSLLCFALVVLAAHLFLPRFPRNASYPSKGDDVGKRAYGPNEGKRWTRFTDYGEV